KRAWEKGEKWCRRAIWGNTLPSVKDAWKSADEPTLASRCAPVRTIGRDRLTTPEARPPSFRSCSHALQRSEPSVVDQGRDSSVSIIAEMETSMTQKRGRWAQHSPGRPSHAPQPSVSS